MPRGKGQEREDPKSISTDSACGSSMVNTDSDDGDTPTVDTGNYNQDMTHKVIFKLTYQTNYTQHRPCSRNKCTIK